MLPHREEVLLEDLELFNDYWVVTERNNGLTKIHIQTWDGKEDYYLPLAGETYTVYTTTNIAFDTTKLRYVFNSMTTPSSVMEFDMANQSTEILKEQQVLGGKFDKANYLENALG